MSATTGTGDRGEPWWPTTHPQEDIAVDDCLDLVWRFAMDSGLSSAQATDVCLVTLLRLLDRGPLDRPSTSGTSEWALRTAVEECGIARRLASWGRPSLMAAGPQGAMA